MNKKTKIGLAIILAVAILIGAGIEIGINWNTWFGKEPIAVGIDNNTQDYKGQKDTYTGKKKTNSIDIPGFDVMNLKANTKKQSVNLFNPAQNTCYFKMTLVYNGKTLWQSGLVEPGKAIYELNLNEPLPAGKYTKAILKYQCFAKDKNLTPLNGSNVKFTMNVMN